MNTNITMSVAEAAKMMRKAPQYVRLGLQQERIPIRKCSTKK